MNCRQDQQEPHISVAYCGVSTCYCRGRSNRHMLWLDEDVDLYDCSSNKGYYNV